MQTFAWNLSKHEAELTQRLMDINGELLVPGEAAAFQSTPRERQSPVATLFWWKH